MKRYIKASSDTALMDDYYEILDSIGNQEVVLYIEQFRKPGNTKEDRLVLKGYLYALQDLDIITKEDLDTIEAVTL